MHEAKPSFVWSRRKFLTSSSLALGAGLVCDAPLLAQQQGVRTNYTLLRRNVGIFTGRGGTIGWLISPDGVVVIDSQYPQTAQVCLEAIREKSVLKIDFLINTHHHGDHTAGNGVFRPAVKTIVAHKNVPVWQKKQAMVSGSESEQTYADTTFKDLWETSLGDEVISAKYFGRAHTSGDIAILFERANVVHLGDLLFNRRHPFIDRPAGATIAGWISVLEAILEEYPDDALFIFGHSGQGFEITGKKPDLIVQRDYFSALLDHVRTDIKAGKSRETITKSTPILKGFKDHGPLIERVMSVAYDELSESA